VHLTWRCPDERERARAQAAQIVRANWRAIKGLPDVLIERGDMSGDEVRALLGGDWSPRLPAFAEGDQHRPLDCRMRIVLDFEPVSRAAQR
jgi:hypothetical protein